MLPCRVRQKDVRSRKTGPRHPLWTFDCPVHRAHFTVYPPGYLPHGRQAVVNVMPNGTVIDDDTLHKDDGIPSLMEGTLFQVAWDARDEKTWRKALQGPDSPWRTTQVRRLDRVTHLVGVATEVGPQAQLECAEALAVEGAKPLAIAI